MKNGWYKQQDICRQENKTEKVKKSDVLVCKKFGGECSMVKCIEKSK